MRSNGGKGLSNHPLVVVIGLVAACVAIFVFATGYENLPQLLRRWRERSNPQPASSTQVAQPTANTRLPTPHFQTLSLQHWSELTSPETNLGLAPGRNYLLGIPFDTGWKASTQCSHLPSQPESFQWETEIPNPVSVYLLLQAGWGLSRYDGERIGEVRLSFSDGSSVDTPLILGFNIRDWAWESGAAVNTVSSSTSQPAWQGNAPDGTPGGMDVLTIDVPSGQSQLTLTGVRVSDTSQSAIGEVNPCIHLVALTVEYLH